MGKNIIQKAGDFVQCYSMPQMVSFHWWESQICKDTNNLRKQYPIWLFGLTYKIQVQHDRASYDE